MPQIIVSDINVRVRALESRYNLLAEHLLVVNRNMIEEHKNLIEDIKRINESVRETIVELEKTRNTMKSFAKEMQFFAKKQDVQVLEKYINLWNPMEFVTNAELQGLLRHREKAKEKAKKG